MSLIKCPECDKQISDKAKVCPSCGVGIYTLAKRARNLLSRLSSEEFVYYITEAYYWLKRRYLLIIGSAIASIVTLFVSGLLVVLFISEPIGNILGAIFNFDSKIIYDFMTSQGDLSTFIIWGSPGALIAYIKCYSVLYDAIDKPPTLSFRDAIDKNEIEAVRCYLDTDTNLISDEEDWFDLLRDTILDGNYKLLKLLLKSKQSKYISKSERFLNDSLRFATNTKTAKTLVSYGANINSKNGYDETPLDEMILRPFGGQPTEVIPYLIQIGAIHGSLHGAAVTANYKAMDKIIHSNKDLNAKDALGKTALDYVIHDRDVSTYLIENGCNYSTINYALLPLLLDTKKEVKEFLKNGDAVNALHHTGEAPLHLAIYGKRNIEMVKLLVEHGADINFAETEEKWTPLHYAARYGCVDIIDYLIKLGVELNSCNEDGDTPIQIAVALNSDDEWRDYKEAVKLLISAGANLNNVNMNGKTALDIAARKLGSTVKSILKNNGAKSAEDLAS